jgi:hypothetical protein
MTLFIDCGNFDGTVESLEIHAFPSLFTAVFAEKRWARSIDCSFSPNYFNADLRADIYRNLLPCGLHNARKSRQSHAKKLNWNFIRQVED